MKKSNLFIFALVAITLSGCVSKRLYRELELKHNTALAENERLSRENQDLLTAASKAKSEYDLLKADRDKLADELTREQRSLSDLQFLYDNLKKEHDALLANNSSLLGESAQKQAVYAAELEAKQKLLADKENRISELQAALDRKEADLLERENRLAELQATVAEVQKSMDNIRSALSAALSGFQGKGLSISQRDGKIYVSMENKLLFASGSWTVNSEGRRAVEEIAKVLVSHPQLNVVIEGHTDNVPYNGSGSIKDNWDLSVMRATSIVKLLQNNPQIQLKNITAAGRSEYAPLVENNSAENRARNRRIELIIMPDLSAIQKLLSTKN